MKNNYYGLQLIRDGSSTHAIVLLHGIRQTRDDIRTPFGENITKLSKNSNIYIYGYDHTKGLIENGDFLASEIVKEIKCSQIDIVGYSMGGLVARLAASAINCPQINTVVTLSTPNRGSLSNAELTTLGQIGRSVFEFISPMAPRTEGVKDLTRAALIMSERRQQLIDKTGTSKERVVATRYASIPALFYHPLRSETEMGPTMQMSGLQAVLLVGGLRRRLLKMQRSHDGIVTETSNDLTSSGNYDWSEIHLTKKGQNGEPSLCHAVVDECQKHDHMSILNDELVAQLIVALIDCKDWRLIENGHPTLYNRVRVKYA